MKEFSENENKYSETFSHFVGIKFDNGNRAYFFGIKDIELSLSDKVVVETIRGTELGEVAIEPVSISEYKSELELKPIIRKAEELDIKIYEANKEASKTALELCKKEIINLGLDMNLTSCEYTLDKSKVIFSYVADERVDFRELLKVLATKLHTRIELRQIGPRDKAKSIGGIGLCGLPLCCSSFLNEFDGISIGRAKNQMLAINIPKLSGQCGKLICCLKYEDDAYTDAKKNYPEVGTKVIMDDNEYTITNINIISGMLKLETKEDIKFMSFEDVKKQGRIKYLFPKREQKNEEK